MSDSKIPQSILEQFGDNAKHVADTLKGFGLHIFDSSNEIGSKILHENGLLTDDAKKQLGKFATQAQEFITTMLGGKKNEKPKDDAGK